MPADLFTGLNFDLRPAQSAFGMSHNVADEEAAALGAPKLRPPTPIPVFSLYLELDVVRALPHGDVGKRRVSRRLVHGSRRLPEYNPVAHHFRFCELKDLKCAKRRIEGVVSSDSAAGRQARSALNGCEDDWIKSHLHGKYPLSFAQRYCWHEVVYRTALERFSARPAISLQSETPVQSSVRM